VRGLAEEEASEDVMALDEEEWGGHLIRSLPPRAAGGPWAYIIGPP